MGVFYACFTGQPCSCFPEELDKKTAEAKIITLSLSQVLSKLLKTDTDSTLKELEGQYLV